MCVCVCVCVRGRERFLHFFSIKMLAYVKMVFFEVESIKMQLKQKEGCIQPAQFALTCLYGQQGVLLRLQGCC